MGVDGEILGFWLGMCVFDLKKHFLREQPGVKMFVKSAYLRKHAAKANAQSWRFVSLAGQIAGVLRK